MPIYEYTCQKCEHRFEQLVRTMDTKASFKCPKCGSPQTQRAMSVFAAVSTGSSDSAGGDDAPACCPCGREGGCRMG